MSGGGRRPPPHLSWCPALSNRFRAVPGVKGQVRYEPVGPVFDCLCKHGRIQLTDPRPELVEAAVARAKARGLHLEGHDAD